jgi:hypothetical protein
MNDKDRERDHLLKMRETHTRRLEVLELQAARRGDSAEAHVILEIQDIRARIQQIDDQLGGSAKGSMPPAPSEPGRVAGPLPANPNQTTVNTGGGDYAGGNIDKRQGGIFIENSTFYGDIVSGDKIAGDKVAGDKIVGDKPIHESDRSTFAPTNVQQRRNQIFISYSHSDKRWLDRLHVHLKPLERDNTIVRWDDTMIKPGSKWREEIDKALKATKVAILLISADFLASDFIATDELPPLLKAAEEEGAVILPMIVSASRFTQTKSLSVFQAVNQPSQPLAGLPRHRQEEVLVKVAEAVEQAIGRGDS